MLIALAGVAVAAPVGVGHGASGDVAAALKRPPLKATAQVYDSGFMAPTVTIRKGGTIKWVWDISLLDNHNVTYLKGPSKYFTSRALGSGASFRRKFTKAGKYMIYCSLHAGNTQKIIVK